MTDAIIYRYLPSIRNRSKPGIVSPEIETITLHNPIAFTARVYAAPFLCKPSAPFPLT